MSSSIGEAEICAVRMTPVRRRNRRVNRRLERLHSRHAWRSNQDVMVARFALSVGDEHVHLAARERADLAPRHLWLFDGAGLSATALSIASLEPALVLEGLSQLLDLNGRRGVLKVFGR